MLHKLFNIDINGCTHYFPQNHEYPSKLKQGLDQESDQTKVKFPDQYNNIVCVLCSCLAGWMTPMAARVVPVVVVSSSRLRHWWAGSKLVRDLKVDHCTKCKICNCAHLTSVLCVFSHYLHQIAIIQWYLIVMPYQQDVDVNSGDNEGQQSQEQRLAASLALVHRLVQQAHLQQVIGLSSGSFSPMILLLWAN